MGPSCFFWNAHTRKCEYEPLFLGCEPCDECPPEEPYDEKLFLDDLTKYYARAGNAMRRFGFTVDKLRRLPVTLDKKGMETWYHYGGVLKKLTWYHWSDLFMIEYFGDKSMLKLVEFCRSKGVELPWFQEWEKWYTR